jgi:hypothetical protein
MEIGQYDVEFIPQWMIKSQALTNFIVVWTDARVRGIDELPNHWVMYFEKFYTLKGVGAGVMLIPHEVIFSNMTFSLISQLQ